MIITKREKDSVDWFSYRTYCKKLKAALALATLYCLVPGSAVAVSIDGVEATKLFSFYTGGDDFGVWDSMNKLYTFRSNDNYIRPNRINRVSHRGDGFADVSFRDVTLMGTTNATRTEIEAATLDLFGPGGTLLLSGTYASASTISRVFRPGTAGQLDVSGIFQATGGSLFQNGLVSSSFYIELEYDRVWKNVPADFKADNGTWTFYGLAETPPNTEVPEPATVALLAGGLVGLIRKKHRAQES